jgi:hypothetical protein
MALNLQTKEFKRKPGRPRGSYSAARPTLDKVSAAQVLSLYNERALWGRLLSSEDDRVVLDAVKFLVVMRDGKPVQQINVATTNVNISLDDIAKARAIARTLLPMNSQNSLDNTLTNANMLPMNSAETPSARSGDEDVPCIRSQRQSSCGQRSNDSAETPGLITPDSVISSQRS